MLKTSMELAVDGIKCKKNMDILYKSWIL